MDKIKVKWHTLYNHLPKRVSADYLYWLRNKQDNEYVFKNFLRCRTKRSQDFFMLNILSNYFYYFIYQNFKIVLYNYD